ncbi:MAG: D-arabinono-1,4-lactone oxidase [Bacteroidota bacterium]
MIEKIEKSLEKFSNAKKYDEAAIKAFRKQVKKASKIKAPSVRKKKFKATPFIKVKDLEFSIAHNVEVKNPVNSWQYDKQFIYIKPYSLKGTVNAIRYMEAAGAGLKGIGSRHSYSKVVEADHCYIDMKEASFYDGSKKVLHHKTLKKIDQKPIRRLKKEVLAKGRKEYYFNVPAGMTIGELNQVLGPEKKGYQPFFGPQKPKRIFNMGGGDIQAFAGAFSTGTHGSGGIHSAYHDMVRSILLVASEGRLFRIEPSGADAITDPVRHEKFYANKPTEEQVTLIQDDDAFYSTLVSMGCFGIIYSAIIEIKDMTLLHENMIYLKEGWTKAEKENCIKANQIWIENEPEKEMFYSVHLNPYKVGKAKYPSMMTEIIVPTEHLPKNKRARKRNMWPSFAAEFGLVAPIIQIIANSGSFHQRRLIESSLEERNDNFKSRGKGYVDLAYKVWSADGGNLNTIGSGIEFAFPMEEITDVVDGVMKFVEQEARNKTGLYLNAPMVIRFVRPSKAYLAPNYYKYKNKEVKLWCYLEILKVNNLNQKDNEREYEIFYKLQELLFKAGGRPHWGLNIKFKFNQSRLKQLYPKYKTWKKNFDFFNPTGSFDNDFVRDSGIRRQA